MDLADFRFVVLLTINQSIVTKRKNKHSYNHDKN